MTKCLLLLAVLSLAFTAGSTIRCYSCVGDGCKDPYIRNIAHETYCPLGVNYCMKAKSDTGDYVVRDCSSIPDYLSTFQHNESKGLQDGLAGRQVNEVVLSFCNNKGLCNGTGRPAEICTMMILLPASLVLLISFFSRQ